MQGIGEVVAAAFLFLATVAGFGVMALVAGLGLALWSIWLPITLWQAIPIMAAFGLFGAFLTREAFK